MQNDIPDKSIVEKIRKLLALADSNRNSHSHEREVAMQAALDLLAKHNLSMTQVNNSALDIQPEEVRANFKLDPWIRSILSAACQLYYTEYYMSSCRDWNGRVERTPVFVGTTENIAVTIDMANWLIESVRQESNRVHKEQYERRSFRLGAAWRIRDRAHEIMQAEKQAAATTTGTSLMIIRNRFDQANQKHLAGKNLSAFRSRPLYLCMDAFSNGEAFGDQVGLTRQMNYPIKRLPLANPT